MDQSLKETKWLCFEELPKLGKTRRIVVKSKTRGYHLGDIRWYGPWRQYIFEPAAETMFNVGCLTDIADKLGYLNTMQRDGQSKTLAP